MQKKTIGRRKMLTYLGVTAGSSALLSRTVRGATEEMVGVPGFGPRPASEVTTDSSGGGGVKPKDVLSGRDLARLRGNEERPPDFAGDHGPPDFAGEQGPPDHSEAGSSSPSTLTNYDTEDDSNGESDEPGVPANNTYLAYVSDRFYNGTYHTMSASWTVPEKPKDYNGLQDPNMYYFTGLLNTLNPYDLVSRKIILQPVLNWNRFEGYEGEWSIAAWWADNQGNAFHSTPMAASPGDELFGFINYQENPDWYISIYNRSTGKGTDLTAPAFTSRTFDRSIVALESNFWDKTSCDQLPGRSDGCIFQNISLKDTNGDTESPEWRPDVLNLTTCPLAVAHDPTTVGLYTSVQ